MANAFLEYLIGQENASVIRGVVELSVRTREDDEFAEYYGLVDEWFILEYHTTSLVGGCVIDTRGWRIVGKAERKLHSRKDRCETTNRSCGMLAGVAQLDTYLSHVNVSHCLVFMCRCNLSKFGKVPLELCHDSAAKPSRILQRSC